MACFTWLYNKIRNQLVESKSRTEYHFNRWKASRVRRRWLKQENKYRKELEYTLKPSKMDHEDFEFHKNNNLPMRIAPLYTAKTQKNRLAWMTQMNYKNLNLDESSNDNEIPMQSTNGQDTNKGVSVLSPQRLSERLSENALAREAVGESDLELAQYLKDERIALFLQNDEFISELRSNKEFMTALQRDHEGDDDDDDEYDNEECNHSFRGSRRLNSKRSDSGGSGGMGMSIPPLDDATFRERLANMGKASRKKFAQLAKVFSRGKRPSGPRTLLPSGVGGTSDTNGKDLLMSSEALIDDYDDDKNTPINEEVITPLRKNP